MAKGDEKRHSRAWIFISLFLVRGPFALRLLWRSAEFERNEKMILTIAVVLYTVTLVAAFIFVAKSIHTHLAF